MSCVCWEGYTRLRKRPVPKNSGFASVINNEHTFQPITTASAYDPLYAWIDEGEARDEMNKISSLRKALTPAESEQLSSAPTHIKHDLMLCRFLRGHNQKVASALKALRAHLKLRQKHAAILAQITKFVPADTEDFSEDLSPFASRFRKLKMLQLPGRHGTNDGMPLSLIALGRFKIEDLVALDAEELAMWLLSLIEIRCICLHNQSIREHRMARVTEMRDCVGVAWSQFFSAQMLRKVPRILEIAMVYPELVGSALLFNMVPRSIFTSAIRNMVPQSVRDKVLFATRGNWEECICVKRGLSLEAVVRWAKYLEEFRANQHRQTLNSYELQTVRAISVSAGDVFSWRVRCGHGPGRKDVHKSSPVVRSCVHLFANTQLTPTHDRVFLDQHGWDSVCSGTLQAPVDGVALLEIELLVSGSVDVFAILVLGSEATDTLPDEVQVTEMQSGPDTLTCQSRCFPRTLFVCLLLVMIFGLALGLRS